MGNILPVEPALKIEIEQREHAGFKTTFGCAGECEAPVCALNRPEIGR
jgi:hypothetical protein